MEQLQSNNPALPYKEVAGLVVAEKLQKILAKAKAKAKVTSSLQRSTNHTSMTSSLTKHRDIVS